MCQISHHPTEWPALPKLGAVIACPPYPCFSVQRRPGHVSGASPLLRAAPEVSVRCHSAVLFTCCIWGCQNPCWGTCFCSTACSSARSTEEGAEFPFPCQGASNSGPEMSRCSWEACSTSFESSSTAPSMCLQDTQPVGSAPVLQEEMSACLLRNFQ